MKKYDPKEIVDVSLSVEVSGIVHVKMTREQYDETFPDGEGCGLDLDAVPNIDFDEALNMLNFEVEDAWVDKDLGEGSVGEDDGDVEE